MSTAPVVKIAGTGAAAATWTTASYTPAANSREVAYVSAFKSTAGVALPTISDTAGNNWTQLASFETTTASNPNIRGVWFISDDVGGSPAARTVTVASTGAASMAVMVADVLSADTDGTLAQAAVGGEDLANGDPSCTFGSTPGASNICLAGASFGGGNTATARPTGFSNLANFNHSTARANSASYDVASASQGPLQYTSLNIRSIILAIELAPAGAGTQNITGALFTDGDTFYGATVAPGDAAITGALFTNANTVYAATVSQAGAQQDITGALFTNANSLFGSTVSATYGVSGALFTDADTFFGSTVTASYPITGGLFTDADTFFGATVSSPYGIAGNLYSNVNTFFGATVSQSGNQTITGALYANDNSFFGSTVTGQSTARQIGGGGGFPLTDQHVRDLQAAAQRQRDHQDRTDAQKRRDAADLRKALERAWQDIKEEVPAVFVEAAPEVNFERKKVDWTPLVRDHDAILRVLDDVKAKLAEISLKASEGAAVQAAIMAEQNDDEAVALIFLAA